MLPGVPGLGLGRFPKPSAKGLNGEGPPALAPDRPLPQGLWFWCPAGVFCSRPRATFTQGQRSPHLHKFQPSTGCRNPPLGLFSDFLPPG